jgi:hypothetical protein
VIRKLFSRPIPRAGRAAVRSVRVVVVEATAALDAEPPFVERVVEVITSDPELWTQTMMTEELGFGSAEPNEYRAAVATLIAFLTVGFLPLRSSSTTSPPPGR